MPILSLNTESYNKYIQADKPILVEFSAPWCVYCRRLAPALAETAEQYRDKLLFAEVNIDEVPDLAAMERVEVIPTLLIYNKGNRIGDIVAPSSKAQLEEFITEVIGNG